MSTLDTDINSAIRKKQKTSRILYIIATVFCFVFQLVYGMYSHGVHSVYMTWAFVIPLSGGIINELSYHIRKTRFQFIMRQLLAGGLIWLTLGSIFEGVLEIYGTTNNLISVFLIIGLIQVTGALAAFITTLLSVF